jgi:hypothetical protein
MKAASELELIRAQSALDRGGLIVSASARGANVNSGNKIDYPN